MMIGLRTPGLREIAVLGVRCGDIAAGMGGTLLTLTSGESGSLRIRALVLSGANTHREVEEHRTLSALCGSAELDLRVLQVPGSSTGWRGHEMISALEEIRYRCEPDVVYGPHRAAGTVVAGFSEGHGVADRAEDADLSEDADFSQDTGIAEYVHQVFRDHVVLGYETPHRRAAAGAATLFHPLTREVVERKTHIVSAPGRSGPADLSPLPELARLRGLQCGSPYAEAFVAEKVVLPDPSGRPSAPVARETGRSR